MLEAIEANNEHVIALRHKILHSYTGHPSTTNGQLHVSDQKM